MDEIAKLQRRVSQLEGELQNERTGRKNDRATWQRKGALRELREAFVRAGCDPEAAALAATSIVTDHASEKRAGAVRVAELALDEDGAIGKRSWLLDGYHDDADSIAKRFLEHAPFFRGAPEQGAGAGGSLRELAASALRDAVQATGSGLRPLVATPTTPVQLGSDATPRDRAVADVARILAGG